MRFLVIPFFILILPLDSSFAATGCYQWSDAERSAGVLIWEDSPLAACQDRINLGPHGNNNSAGEYSNSITGLDFNGGSDGGFPVAYCHIHQIDNWYPQSPPLDFTEPIGYQKNPAGCGVYVTAPAIAAAQCGPACNGVAEPINPISGAVYDTTIDTPSTARSLSLKRFYNSTDSGCADVSGGWRHSFSRSIKPRNSSSQYQPWVASSDNSSRYSDEATACTSGFAEIKGRMSTWASATAGYANGVCTLSVGSMQIGTLPLLYESPPTPVPGTTSIIAYEAIRDDGQLIRFTINGNSISAPPSIGIKFQATATGYTLTDANDNVEVYNTNGVLQTITSRAAVVQTMNYDTSGRLSTVLDSFGHKLSLGYDAQNRVFSVTRQ